MCIPQSQLKVTRFSETMLQTNSRNAEKENAGLEQGARIQEIQQIFKQKSKADNHADEFTIPAKLN